MYGTFTPLCYRSTLKQEALGEQGMVQFVRHERLPADILLS